MAAYNLVNIHIQLFVCQALTNCVSVVSIVANARTGAKALTMQIIARLEHTTENCWAREENERKATEWIEGMEDRARDADVEVHGSYVCPNEHTFYFVLESDSFEGVSEFLGPPLLTDHDAHITPVVSFAEAERAVRD